MEFAGDCDLIPSTLIVMGCDDCVLALGKNAMLSNVPQNTRFMRNEYNISYRNFAAILTLAHLRIKGERYLCNFSIELFKGATARPPARSHALHALPE